MSKVSFEVDDGTFCLEEYGDEYLHIRYDETACDAELPILTKEQWEKLKRAGDYIFSEMED